MLMIKLLLVAVLAIAPVNAILALPVVSPAVVIAVIGLAVNHTRARLLETQPLIQDALAQLRQVLDPS